MLSHIYFTELKKMIQKPVSYRKEIEVKDIFTLNVLHHIKHMFTGYNILRNEFSSRIKI